MKEAKLLLRKPFRKKCFDRQIRKMFITCQLQDTELTHPRGFGVTPEFHVLTRQFKGPALPFPQIHLRRILRWMRRERTAPRLRIIFVKEISKSFSKAFLKNRWYRFLERITENNMIVSSLAPWAFKPWFGLVYHIAADKQKQKQTLSKKTIACLNYTQKGHRRKRRNLKGRRRRNLYPHRYSSESTTNT